MKKFGLLLLLISTFIFTSCDCSWEISGIENFSDQTCSFGLNDDLFPRDTQFLSDFAYENAIYYYWNDGNYEYAKTFVFLQYSEPIYQKAKRLCEEYYSFLNSPYCYEDFVFSNPNTLFIDEGWGISGMQMLGYNDEKCTLIFIGSHAYAFDRREACTASDFVVFFDEEYGECYKLGQGTVSGS